MNHLLGWECGTYSYVSTNRATDLSGLIRVVRSFGLLHREIPLVVARFVARTHFCISNNADHCCPWEFHLRTADVDTLADGPLTWPATFRHRFIHDHNGG